MGPIPLLTLERAHGLLLCLPKIIKTPFLGTGFLLFWLSGGADYFFDIGKPLFKAN